MPPVILNGSAGIVFPDSISAGISTFSTAATSIEFNLSTGNFDAGSIKVYGVK